MQAPRTAWLGLPIAIFLLISIACQSLAPAAPTVAPTNTPVAPTSTPTIEPTATLEPTATPDLAATQFVEDRLSLLQTYADAGYIPSTSGQFEDIDDFSEEWAQLGYYSWWPVHESSVEYGDMVFQAHFAWETAASTSDLSGCGIVFGLQSSGDYYAVFVDKARILFQMARGGQPYLVGKTSGSGRLNLGNPAEADVAVIVQGATTHVVVNGQATKYTLSADQTSSGELAYSILSGTNKDFGTRCTISDAYIWTPDE